MSRALISLSLVLTLHLLLGCDTSGIHPIGQILDVTPNCDPLNDANHTTWLRTMQNSAGEPIGTEVLVFGFDPEAPPAPRGGSHCMQRIKVYRSTTTEGHFGVVNLSAVGEGTHTEGVRCSFPQEPGRNVLRRRGAQCYELGFHGYIDRQFSFAMSGDILEVSWAEDEADLLEEDFTDNVLRAPEMSDRVPAGTYRYMSVGDVVASINTTPTATLEDATAVFQLYNLALLTSQTRLAGFGSGGMTQYLNSTSAFVGLIGSEFTVNVVNVLNPRTTIHYASFQDLTGLIVGAPEGEDQITVVNAGGNGGMEGSLSYYLLADRTNPASAVEGDLDYSDVEINSGFGNAGTYHLTIDSAGATFDLPVADQIEYDETLPGFGHFDMSPILPVDL